MGLSILGGDWGGLCSQGRKTIQLFITISKSWVQEVFDVISLGIIGISGIGWKERGGVRGANQKWTWGLPIRTGGNVVVGRSVFGGANGFALTYLFGQYGSTLLVQLLGTVLQSTWTQAPLLHKPFVPQSKALSFCRKNCSLSWPCKLLTCVPSYVQLVYLANFFFNGFHA